MRKPARQTAVAAAQSLDPADLQKILESKKPPSPEELDKSVIEELMTQAEKLPSEELSAFVRRHEKALRELHILHVKRNVSQVQFSTPELNGLLMVLDKLPKEQKVDLTTRIQQAAVAAGLEPGQGLQVFAQKLTRIGLHL